MRPDGIVVDPPLLDHHACFGQRVEDLAVQQLVPELRIEALAVAVLPGATRFDERRLRAHGVDPVPNGLCDELRPVVRPNMAGHASQDEQVGQDVDHGGRIQLPVDPDRQALPGELVDHVEHTELPPVVRPALDEVVGPDVVRALGPKTDA